ncbi:MAG: hypothetical protein IKP40_05095 [Clostridia bacterium]|nr:hypothetical protein [Clostridia bacterium]
MKTDVITVSSRGSRMETPLQQAEKVAAYKGLSPRSALHLRLLTEEMMGLMRSITGETEGRFWIEDEDGVYELHLSVQTGMNSSKRDQLLSVSSSGQNDSARGLMGRLRDFFDRGADEDVASFTSPLMLASVYDNTSSPTLDWEWTMSAYQRELGQLVSQRNPEAQEAWDEMEKSVVTHVADDVKVSIRGRTAELILVKKMA